MYTLALVISIDSESGDSEESGKLPVVKFFRKWVSWIDGHKKNHRVIVMTK